MSKSVCVANIGLYKITRSIAITGNVLKIAMLIHYSRVAIICAVQPYWRQCRVTHAV